METLTLPLAIVHEYLYVGKDRYDYVRTAHLGPYTIRAHVSRHSDPGFSYTAGEILSSDMAWTQLVMENADSWFDRTTSPSEHVDVKFELGGVADEVIHLVTTVLPRGSADTGTSALYAVGALLTVAFGSTGERVLTPEDVQWAKENGGPFRMLPLPGGEVLMTKAHRYDCPLLATNGAEPCDGACRPGPDALPADSGAADDAEPDTTSGTQH